GVYRGYVVTSYELQYFFAIRWHKEDRVVPHNESAGSARCNNVEGRIVVALINWHDKQIAAQHSRSCENVALQVLENHGIWRARQIRNRGRMGDYFAQELEAFASKLGNAKIHSGEVTFRPIQSNNESILSRILRADKDNWNRRSSGF